MKRGLLLAVLCLMGIGVRAQFSFPTMGAGAGMGGCFHPSDPWSQVGAVAGTAFAKQQEVGVGAACHQYMPSMNDVALVYLAGLPGRVGFGLQFNSFGSAQYQEQQASLGCGIEVARGVAVGVQLSYLRSATADSYYPSVDFLSCALGLQWRISQGMALYLLARNPYSFSLSQDLMMPPAHYAAGLSYYLLPDFLTTLGVEKGMNSPMRLRMGLEYAFSLGEKENQVLFARTGVATAPFIYTAGLGYRNSHLGMDVAMQSHQVLGISPQLSLSYRF